MTLPTEYKVTACDVTLGSTNLGTTKGGVTVTLENEYVDIVADQYGSGLLDQRLLGEKATITVPLAEITQTNLGKILPLATDVASSLKKIGSKPGASMFALAERLVLNPVDGSDDVIFHKAVAVNVAEMQYSPEEQLIYEVTFIAYTDTSRTDGDMLARIGDSSAT